MNVNQFAPVLTQPSSPHTVSEGDPIGTNIVLLSASDADNGIDGEIFFRICPNYFFTIFISNVEDSHLKTGRFCSKGIWSYRKFSPGGFYPVGLCPGGFSP